MMTWEKLFDTVVTPPEPGYREVAAMKRTWSCGTTSVYTLVRERGSWRVFGPDYTESFKSKKATLATYPEFAGF